MILIVFATELEAEGSIEALGAKPSLEGLFSFDGGQIAVSGMGVIRAAIAVAKYGVQAQQVWNVGLAGALSPRYQLGQWATIGSVRKCLTLAEGISDHALSVGNSCFDEIVVGHGSARLISVDFPIYSGQQKEKLQSVADLVDMEGYGVAQAAKALDKPCSMWKMISDMADAKGLQSLRENREALSNAVAEQLVLRLDSPL